MFRPVASTAARLASYSLGLLVSAVSGLLVARYLRPHEYTFYRVAGLRAPSYVAPLLSVVSWWGYRYAAMGDVDAVKSAVVAALVLGVASAASSIAVGVLLEPASYSWLVLASIYSYLLAVFGVVAGVANAVRPARTPLAVLVRRVVFTTLVAVVLLVYRLGVVGVMAAGVASFTLSLLVLVSYLGPWMRRGRFRVRVVFEWFRGFWVPFLSGVAGLAASLDALIAAKLWGARDAAAFMASTLPAFLVAEASSYAIGHLQAYILGGGGLESAFAAARVATVAVLPLLVYMAVQSKPIVSLVNPAYLDYHAALPVVSMSVLVAIVSTTLWQVYLGFDRSRASAVGVAQQRYTLTTTIISPAYLAALILLSKTTGRLDVGWGLAILLRSAASAIVAYSLLPLEARRQALGFMGRVSAYTAILALLASFFKAPLKLRLLQQLEALTPVFALYAVIAYAFLVAVDDTARKALQRMLVTARQAVATRF